MNLLNNTKWVAFTQIVKIFCQLINLIVLARLILPSEYGLMAMASVVVALGFLFRDMGTSAAIIQKRTITEDLKNAVFWLNIFTGSGLGIIIVLVSPLAAIYFRQPELLPVLILLALSFPITSFSSSHLALLERESLFKKIAYIESMSALCSTLVAITAAYNSWGVYSLVVQSITNAILSTILIWRASSWYPSINGYRYIKEIKQIISFSGNLVIFNFINYFYRNADRYVIGRMMTSAILGAYDLAYKIMLFPLQTLTFVIGRALFPILSQLQDQPKKFNELFLKVTMCIAFFSFPLMCSLFVLRVDFINMVFGSRWDLVADILFWMAPIGILQSLNSSTGGVLAAKGRTDILLYLGIIGSTLTVSSFFISALLNQNIVDFCRNYFIANILNFIIAIFIVCKVIKLSIFLYFKSFLSIVIASIFLCLALYYFNLNVPINGSLLFFSLNIIFGLLLYIIILLIVPNGFFLNFFKEFVSNYLKRGEV